MSNEKETNPAAGLKEYPYAEAVEGAKEYFGGDDLAATVWVSKYALKDSFGKIYEKSPVCVLVCCLPLERDISGNLSVSILHRT